MSQKDEIVEKAQKLAEPLIAAEGLELLEVEWLRENGSWILRLYIDKPGDKVGLDDCQKASHAVETALDVEDFIPQAYSLEVSSPGLNRPLTKDAHFLRAIGKKVKIKTYGPIGDPPRKNFSGKLTAFADATATVAIDGAGEFKIPLKDVAKANLEFEFEA